MIKKRITLFCAVFFLFQASVIFAQTNAQRQPLIIHSSADKRTKKALLEFEIPVEEDVLILITDSAGITIFLENKYRFKGKYKREVQLAGKGPFNLKISRFNENINRRLELK